MKTIDSSWLAKISKQNAILVLYPKLGSHGAHVPEEVKNECAMTGCTDQLMGFKALLEEFSKLGFSIYAIGTISTQKQDEFKAAINTSEIEFISDEGFLLESELGATTFLTNQGVKFYLRQDIVFKDGKLALKRVVKNAATDAKELLEIVKSIS